MNSRIAYIALATSAACVACAHPAAVGSFATAAAHTTMQFPQVAGDLYESCVRFEAYRQGRSPTQWYEREGLTHACASRDSAVKRVVAVNRVLTGYLNALAALADDRVVAYDRQLDKVGAALINDAHLDKARVKAASGLAAFVATAATEGYRRRQLEQAIASQNDNVRDVVETLREVIATDYANALDVEGEAMTVFYRSLLQEHAARDPLGAVLVRDVRDERATQLADRRQTLSDYAEALRDVRAGHQRLFASRHEMDSSALAADLAAYAERLQAVIVAFQKAY